MDWLKRKRELWTFPTAWDYEVEQLAVYNSERARGIVHTAEYDARMATIQQEWNRRQREGWAARGVKILGDAE